MISTKRKPFQTGQSKGITLPAAMTIGKEVSMAAGDRLIIMDTTGEVPHNKLLQFYLQYVEPAFQNWWEAEKQASRRPKGGFRVLQEEGPTPAKAVKPPHPTMVRPEAQIRPVICPRCGGQISWNIEQGLEGFCPYCNTFLQLIP